MNILRATYRVFIWWYMAAGNRLGKFIQKQVNLVFYGLGIRVLFKNLLSPLFGMNKWHEHMISFLVRFFHFSFILIFASTGAIGIYSFLVAYLAFPLLIPYLVLQQNNIVFQLTDKGYEIAAAVYVSMLILYLITKGRTDQSLKSKINGKEPKNLLNFVNKEVKNVFAKSKPLREKLITILSTDIAKEVFVRIEMDETDFNDFHFGETEDTLLKTALKLAWHKDKINVEVIDILEAIWKCRPKDDLFWNKSPLKDNIQDAFDYYQRKKEHLEYQNEWGSYAIFQNKDGIDRGLTSGYSKYVNEFTRNTSGTRSQSQITNLVGREGEWNQMLESLRHKGNAILLVGRSGVGKTRMIEHLAEKVAADQVPGYLQDMRVVELDIGRVLSGDGQNDSHEGGKNLIAVLDEITNANHIILTIDNIITLAGENFASLANLSILSKYIENKKIHLIATSTKEDYERFLTHNPTYVRLFTKIHLEEFEDNHVKKVLAYNAINLEKKYGAIINQQCFESILDISKKHSTQIANPASALHLLEETISANATSKVITSEDIKRTIEKNTGIKLTKIENKEKEKLTNLEAEIHKTIVSQEIAVQKVADALRRARLDLHDYKGPIAKFLFVGSTGVGKTELAKTVANIHFGSEKKIVRFDMSEYQELDSIKRLIGDGKNPGMLTEPIKTTPHSLVLFDEIEKAHPKILHLLLQVLDDGRITDGHGQTVDFRNTIIIATSNAGAEFLWKGLKARRPFDEIKKELKEEVLIQHFKPEFLNRFSHISIFHPLEKDHIVEITKRLLSKAKDHFSGKDIKVEFTDTAAKTIADDAFSLEMGARPIKYTITDRLESQLAKLLLAEENKGKRFVFDGKMLTVKI